MNGEIRADRVAGRLDATTVNGRIEATDTSRIFHFVDDVVIRVMPDAAGARVDIRSRSRDGLGDMGANAKRIAAYSAALEAQGS